MQKTKVLVAIGNLVFQEGLCSLLNQKSAVKIIGRVADGEQAIVVAKQLIPDVIIIDTHLPGADVIKVCEQIKIACPNIATIILSLHPYESEMIRCIQAGAASYLSFDTAPRELLGAIYSIRRGEAVIDLQTIRQAFECIGVSNGRVGSSKLLRRRELEVLRLAAGGLSNKQIGTKLFISERTVQSHMIHIFTKLEVGSRTEAVAKGLREGWLTSDSAPSAEARLS